MGEIVNLNRARKDRAKVEAKAAAATNRIVHGRTKMERGAAKTEHKRAERLIDGHKLEKKVPKTKGVIAKPPSEP